MARNFVILDTETTSKEPGEAKVVEVAAVRVSPEGVLDRGSLFHTLINPQCEIPPGSSAIHHLTARDVEKAPTLQEIAPKLLEYVGDDIPCAHNSKYDSAVLASVGLPKDWLCTMRLAKHLWPDAPGYSNQHLRYWLGFIDIDLLGYLPHRAAADILVSAAILHQEYSDFLDRGLGATPDDLLALSQKRIEVTKLSFGKYSFEKTGKLLRDIPLDYLQWLKREKTDMDDDLAWSVDAAIQAYASHTMPRAQSRPASPPRTAEAAAPAPAAATAPVPATPAPAAESPTPPATQTGTTRPMFGGRRTAATANGQGETAAPATPAVAAPAQPEPPPKETTPPPGPRLNVGTRFTVPGQKA